MSETQNNNFHCLVANVKRLIGLELDYARLTAAEKTTVLLSSIAFYAVVVLLGTMLILFISIGVGHLLAETIAPHFAYLFVAAFYLILFILAFIFRRKLFVDPTARFITRLFLNPPKEEEL